MKIKTFAIALLTLLLVGPTLLGTTLTGTAFADSPAGTWSWEHPTQDGQGSTTDYIDIVDDGGKISGTFRSEQGQLALENVKLDGDDLSFEVNFGQTLAFSGTLSGDTFAGTASITGAGEFPFSAVRESKPVDPTGTWRWETQDPATGQQAKASAVINKENGAISGMLTTPQGVGPLNVVKADGKKLTLGIEFQGTSVTWSGDIDGNSISGTVKGDFGEFPWSAIRDAKQAGSTATATAQTASEKAMQVTINMPDGSIKRTTMKVQAGGNGLPTTYLIPRSVFDGLASRRSEAEARDEVLRFDVDQSTVPGVVLIDVSIE